MIEFSKLNRYDFIPAIVGCLAVTVVALNGPIPLRVVLTLGFCAFCPGLAMTSTFAPRNRLERNVIAIALSLALDSIVTELLAIRHEFTPLTSLVVLTFLVLAKSASTALGVSERFDRLVGRRSRSSKVADTR